MKNSKIFHKDKNGACCDEDNMGSEKQATFCGKDKRTKTCFRWGACMINYISAYKSQMTIMGLDFEADKLRTKAELRVMVAEL